MPARRSSPVVFLTLALVVASAGVVGYLAGTRHASAPPGRAKHTHAVRLLEAASPLQPLPPPPDLDAAKVELGKRLFHERGLSADGTVACASCHDLENGGADHRALSKGVHGRTGTFNAPSVLNASLNFRQFWDGRAQTLEEQVDGPLQSADEMGNTWEAVVAFLASDAEYARAFTRSYADGVTPANVRDAIATFERSATTPHSQFDRYLSGDDAALGEGEREGYRLFLEVGCVRCHRGPNIGGTSFETFGIASNYFEDQRAVTAADLGRYNVTGRERDRYKFKVPSLRNVSRTGPYLHDGSLDTLHDVVQTMALYQLGAELDERECARIVEFLEALDADFAP